MLKNKVIIYDDSCPMCKLYTYWFVAWGFLKPENRIGFATAPSSITDQIDLNRGRHEIPLFDRSTKQTLYGLEALTNILGSKWSALMPFFKTRIFRWLFYPLYQIITYNRRVIAGCKACCGFDCAPDLNRFYRSVYLAIAFVILGCIVAATTAVTFATAWTSNAIFALLSAFASVGLIHTALIRMHWGSIAAWDYAGNSTTTLLLVGLSIAPLLALPGASEALVLFNILFAGLIGLGELRRRQS